jgi:YrbI family 3-deoxy-D-manno-octulosonate 8-phosphate phosphatase
VRRLGLGEPRLRGEYQLGRLAHGAGAAVTARDVVRVALGAEHKTAPWEHIRAELGVEPEACAHMGDDLPDVPLLAACGLALTVPHAPDAVKRHAHYVTRRDGGAGAVREATELILAAQSRLAEAEAAHGAPARGG